tara:strand:- start:92 stop:265 length:174 start_codon:yes stop_codon:yes gene_type:complete
MGLIHSKYQLSLGIKYVTKFLCSVIFVAFIKLNSCTNLWFAGTVVDPFEALFLPYEF